jgi:hypothetical protein
VYGIQAMRHVAVAVVNVRESVRFLFMPSSDPLTNRKNLHNALELAVANGRDQNAEFIMKLRIHFHRARPASAMMQSAIHGSSSKGPISTPATGSLFA